MHIYKHTHVQSYTTLIIFFSMFQQLHCNFLIGLECIIFNTFSVSRLLSKRLWYIDKRVNVEIVGVYGFSVNFESRDDRNCC